MRYKGLLGTWEAEVHLLPGDDARLPQWYFRPLIRNADTRTATIRMSGLPDRTEMDIRYLHGSKRVTSDSTAWEAISFIKQHLEAYPAAHACLSL